MSKPKPTVAYRLFHECFLVGIPNKFLWTDGHIKRVPGYSSPDEDTNRAMLNETTIVARTPVALVLLYDQGVEPVFQNRGDMLTIYNLLTEHLNRWGDIISNPISGRTPPPAEELLIMEDFTHHIYEDAMFEKDTLEAKGKLVSRRNSLEDFFQMFGGRSHRRFTPRLTETPLMDPVNQPPQIGSNIQTAWNNSPWSLINGNSRHSR